MSNRYTMDAHDLYDGDRPLRDTDIMDRLNEQDEAIDLLSSDLDAARKHIRALIDLVGFDQYYIGTDAHAVVHAARSLLHTQAKAVQP
jgi:hypothetical protein